MTYIPKKNVWKIVIGLWIVMLAAMGWADDGQTLAQEQPIRILYVNSYHLGYTWSDQIYQGIRETLGQALGDRLDLRVEFLDDKRFPNALSGEMSEPILRIWQQKYAQLHFDLILISDQAAYNWLQQIRPFLFTEVPLVFAGVEEISEPFPLTTGIYTNTDLQGNIELILNILPQTQRIWTITDYSLTGQANRKRMKQLADAMKDQVEICFLDDEPGMKAEALLQQVAQLESSDVIFFVDYYMDVSGPIEILEFLQRLTSLSPVPVFSHVDLYMEYGVVGGKMSSGWLQGQQMAKIGIDLLNGYSMEQMQRYEEQSMPIFDYSQMQKYDISVHRLPTNSRIINQPDFWHRYWSYIASAFLFALLETYLVIQLLLALRRQKRLQIAEKIAAEKFQALFQLAPIPMVYYSQSGQILDVNQPFFEVIGYSADDISVLEDWWKLAYPDPLYRQKVMVAWEQGLDEIHNTGKNAHADEFDIMCKDGQVRTMEIIIRKIDNNMIVCFLDVTQRKQAEVKLQSSLQLFETLFELAPFSCVINDFNGRYLMVNKAFCESAGRSREEIVGRTINDLGRDFDDKGSQQLVDEIAAKGRVTNQEAVIHDRGEKKNIWFASQLIDWGDEKAIMSTSIDITRRKRAEEALKESEENLRITLNSIGDAVISTDTKGCIMRMNPVAEKLTGWLLDDAIGKPLSEVFHIINAETRQPVQSPVERVLETRKIIGLANHTVLMSRTGTEYQIADSGAPILTDDGEIFGVVLVFRDVTEEYKLQAQLVQSQKMDAIGQLAGGVAHDFNNMLSGIFSATELLQMYCSENASSRNYISIILKATERAADLTKKLLSFARRQPIASTAIDVHVAIQDAVAILERTIDKRIIIQTDLAAESSHVIGDNSQLQNVFLNMGINASHAMPDGGNLSFHSRIIELDSDYCQSSHFDLKVGAYIEVEVRDNGSGISNENVHRIFEPFFTTKEQGKGTGLGLAAAYGTIRQHQGEITVASKVGEGTCFHILLPLTTEAAAMTASIAAPVHGQGSILFVDDEEIVRVVGKAMLERYGYQVHMATNGKEAIRFFTDHHAEIDLVILDMIMPEMNGRDCFIALQNIQPDVKVIMASGFSQDMDLVDIKKRGLIGFIQKPFRGVELSRIVANALEPKEFL